MTLGQVLWRSVDDLQRRSVTVSLDAGTPSCTQPQKPFSIVSTQCSQH